jgi:preprotein translocase subunit SecF
MRPTVAVGDSTSCSGSFDAAGRVISRSCSEGGSGLSHTLARLGIVALVLAPLITAVYLGRRMRSPAASTAFTSARRAASAP